MKNERQVAFTTSSNNIFTDLGLANPEVRRMKTELVVAIKPAMQLRDLNQTQLAELSKTTQPRISRICKGDVDGISNDTLLSVLGAMGYDVDISIVERGQESITYKKSSPSIRAKSTVKKSRQTPAKPTRRSREKVPA